MNVQRGKGLAVAAMLLCVCYLGYRQYEDRIEAAALRETTLERAVPTVAVISAVPLPSNETITLPGNIQAWYEAPIYAQVSGYVKMWYKDYGALVKKGDLAGLVRASAAFHGCSYMRLHRKPVAALYPRTESFELGRAKRPRTPEDLARDVQHADVDQLADDAQPPHRVPRQAHGRADPGGELCHALRAAGLAAVLRFRERADRLDRAQHHALHVIHDAHDLGVEPSCEREGESRFAGGGGAGKNPAVGVEPRAAGMDRPVCIRGGAW